MCARAKLHKANRGPPEDKPAEACWQHIQIDFGFMVQHSQDSKKASSQRTPGPTNKKQRTAIRNLRTLRRSTRSNKFSGSLADTHDPIRPPRPSPTPRAQPSLVSTTDNNFDYPEQT